MHLCVLLIVNWLCILICDKQLVIDYKNVGAPLSIAHRLKALPIAYCLLPIDNLVQMYKFEANIC